MVSIDGWFKNNYICEKVYNKVEYYARGTIQAYVYNHEFEDEGKKMVKRKRNNRINLI